MNLIWLIMLLPYFEIFLYLDALQGIFPTELRDPFLDGRNDNLIPATSFAMVKKRLSPENNLVNQNCHPFA
jgi:hypothetical protein